MFLALILFFPSVIFAEDHPHLSPLSHLAISSELRAPRILIEGTGQLAIRQTIPAARMVRDAFLDAEKIPPMFFFADDKSFSPCENHLTSHVDQAIKALSESGLNYLEKSDPQQMDTYRDLHPEAVFVQTEHNKHLGSIFSNLTRAKSILVDSPFLGQSNEFGLLKEVMRAHPETHIWGANPYRTKMQMDKNLHDYLHKFLGEDIKQMSVVWLDSDQASQAQKNPYQNLASAADIFLRIDLAKLVSLHATELLTTASWSVPQRNEWGEPRTHNVKLNAYVGFGIASTNESLVGRHGLLIIGKNENKVWLDLDTNKAVFINPDDHWTIRPLRTEEDVSVYELTLFYLATKDFSNEDLASAVAFPVESAETFFKFEQDILRRLELFGHISDSKTASETSIKPRLFESELARSQLVFGKVGWSENFEPGGQELQGIPKFPF